MNNDDQERCQRTRSADIVLKLLALAKNNPNVNEAAAAFARAQEIAARHAIDLDTLADDEPDTTPPLTVEAICKREVERMGKVVAWKASLLTVIANANRCKVYTGHTYVNGPMRTLCAYGQPSDLDTVAYMYNAIKREIDRLARDTARGKGRSWGRNFRLGAVHEIGQRLTQARAKAVQSARDDAFARGGETALVRVDRALEHAERIDAACSDYGRDTLRLRSGGGFQGAGSYGYGEGRAAGRSVGLGGGRALSSGGPKALK